MKKQIEELINSFLLDFDQRKLELLDKVLFSLLLKKELLLLEKNNAKEAKKMEALLAYYHNYRDLIFKKLIRNNPNLDKDLLIKRIYQAPARLILLITHSCQLKCRYCRVRKFSDSMKEKILLKAIDLLFTANRRDLQLQFFGGEPLLRFDLVKKAVEYAEKINKTAKRQLTFVLTTNGIALDKEKIDFFKKHKFLIECSIDGEIENQLKMRKARDGKNYYKHLLDNLRRLSSSGVNHYSISVVMPNNVRSTFKSFKHLTENGFKRLQTNYSLGVFWPAATIKILFKETKKILNYAKKNKNMEFINLTSIRREPVVLNAELTVDCNGGIYLESGICLEEDFKKIKNKFLVTDLNKAKNINFYNSTQFQNFYRLSRVYSKTNPRFRKIILNNIKLGQNYNKFLKQKNETGC